MKKKMIYRVYLTRDRLKSNRKKSPARIRHPCISGTRKVRRTLNLMCDIFIKSCNFLEKKNWYYRWRTEIELMHLDLNLFKPNSCALVSSDKYAQKITSYANPSYLLHRSRFFVISIKANDERRNIRRHLIKRDYHFRLLHATPPIFYVIAKKYKRFLLISGKK